MSKESKMKNIPPEERPYERCQLYGPTILNDAELLAVILRTGAVGKNSVELAREILHKDNRNEGLLLLKHLTRSELLEIPGIGEVKATQLLCIGELSNRIAAAQARESLTFDSPAAISNYYMERLRHEEQEVLVCVMLDSKNHLLGDKEISRGTVNAAMISPRELFLSAFSYRAVNILLLHNHPSGVPEPSREDIEITHRIHSLGEQLGITLLDHIVIGDRVFTSMLEEGYLA